MKVWIYLDGRQQGPFEKEELSSIEGFGPSTKVWFEGLAKWYPAGELEQFHEFFSPEAEQKEQHEADSTDHDAATNVGADVNTQLNAATGVDTQASAGQSRYAPGRIYRSITKPTDPCPPTFIGLSIFLLICCCSPISLAALVSSICVTSFYNNGNINKARRASEVTEWLIMVAIALGIIPLMFMLSLF